MQVKKLQIIGLITYFALFILAIFFFKERTIFADIAFHTFTILKTKTFFIQNSRFGAILTQIFPLFASILQLSLKGVLICYSVGFVLVNAIFFGLLTKMQQKEMALSMLLFSTLITAETFFWIQSELPQGIAFTLLTFGFILYKNQLDSFRPWQLALLFCMLLTIIWFHPMLLFVFLFLLIFLKDKMDKNLWSTISWFCGIVIVFKNLVLPRAEYDTQAMGRAKNILTIFPNYFNIPSNKDFLKWCFWDYNLLLLMFIANVVYFFKERNFYKLGLQVSFFIGYLFFINISFHKGDHQFYLENLYLPLVVFVAIPFVFEVRNSFFIKKYQLGILTLIVAFAIFRIGYHSLKWTNRLNWETEMLKKTAADPNKKLIIDEKNSPKDLLVMTWGSSFEFLLLSSLDKPENSRCMLIDEDPKRLDWAKNKTNTFITEWEVWKYDELPKRYFVPTDTSNYVNYTQ
jgi:hypothetical protein